MPNHVTNYLQVIGKSDRVDEFFQVMKTKNHRGENSNFTFNAIIPMPTETLRDDLGERERLEFPGDFNWYDWSIKHWGTKWDAYSIGDRNGDRIQFDTAWSVPVPVLTAASKRFPDLIFIDEYIEEMLESAGEIRFQKGHIVSSVHCSYQNWTKLDSGCLIHKLNMKYQRESYVSYLNELLEEEDPEAEFYLKQIQG